MPATPTLRRLSLLPVGALAALVLAGCGKDEAPPAPPPPQVVIEPVAVRDLPLTLAYPARVSGSRVVEVRARVTGVVTERAYTEGQPVKAGDLLFRIEPDTYQAQLDQARAQTAVQQATITNAQAEYDRLKALVEEGAVSRREFDAADAALRQAKAGTAAANAAQKTAQLSLGYTDVRAPVAGIASKEAVTAGNVVNGSPTSGGDLLTTIVQADPAYVEFSVTESEFLRLRELSQGDDSKLAVKVNSGSSCAGEGRVDFTDTFVNAQTGTVRARAIFDNKDGCLVSGQFLSVAVTGLAIPQAIAVPKEGVLFGQAGAMLWVVGADNTVQPRPVKIRESWETSWILDEGVQAGETIVVQGIMKMRPGAPVVPLTREQDAAQKAEAAAKKQQAAQQAQQPAKED